MNILANEFRINPMFKYYNEVEPIEFYRDIFPDGELDELNKMTKGKYTSIALEIFEDRTKRYSVTNDLDTIKDMISRDNFCIISPISYAGKRKISKNARFLYALCIEVDNLVVKNNKQVGLIELFYQCNMTSFFPDYNKDVEGANWLPKPTYIVTSGNGLHLYYVFEKPIPLFKNIVKDFKSYKEEFTKKLWNRAITNSYKERDIQYESLFQGFRMVGSITKNGDRVHAFKTGKKIDIEYMNTFMENKISIIYKSNVRLEEAKEKWPEWYESRIVNKNNKKSYVTNRAVYDWWKKKILSEAIVGHRYYCLMCLCIYAIKCNINYEEVKNDCYEIGEYFNSFRYEEPFTEKDIKDALKAFNNKDLATYPLNSIQYVSGIKIEKQKRNGRDQESHLKIARGIKKIKKEIGEVKEGRPTKENIVKEWILNNPNKTISDCFRETKISRNTIKKWWIDNNT